MPSIGFLGKLAGMRAIASGELARYHTKGVSQADLLELRLKQTFGVTHALATNSGTSSLVCALVAAGVGPGHEVLVPAYTWVATAAAALAVGATPVLCEINESLTIDPDEIERKISPRTKAIVPVHMINLVADMDRIMAIAKARHLMVIEDACQSVGVPYKGRLTGTIGDAGALSFNQHKNIQAGEGGALLTNSAELFGRAVTYHDVGAFIRDRSKDVSVPLFAGVNYRMPEVTAAMLRPQLPLLAARIRDWQKRRAYAVSRLQKVPGLRICPHNDPAGAVGLAVIFDTEEQAVTFGQAKGAARLIETGRHVYANWVDILGGTRPGTNDIGRPQLPTPDSCPKTLDILRRTCKINLLPDFPALAVRPLVHLMLRHVSKTS